jgi:hypothetical protein
MVIRIVVVVKLLFVVGWLVVKLEDPEDGYNNKTLVFCVCVCVIKGSI